jgi:hypothetical protein
MSYVNPYFNLRHIVKPGITGWAQINFPKATPNDNLIKLEYDLSGFKSWTNEKVDEYFVLDDKGDEESGVIVDDESGEVIETVSDYTSFQNKLLILEEMITSSTK